MQEIDKKTNSEILNDLANSKLDKKTTIRFDDRNGAYLGIITYKNGEIWCVTLHVDIDIFMRDIDTYKKTYEISFE